MTILAEFDSFKVSNTCNSIFCCSMIKLVGYKRGVVHLVFPLLVLLILVLAFLIFSKLKLGKIINLPGDVTQLQPKETYTNPFDLKTQYVNPFSQYKNPFDNLK